MQADLEIKFLGRDAAEAVVGSDAIDRVEVRTGLSSFDEPTYEFYYRFNRQRLPAGLQPGDTLLFLTRRLREALQDRHDQRLPIVHLLNAEDWRRWSGD